MNAVVGIDVGGTHTDCVASDGQMIRVAKVPTSTDPTEGVVEGLEHVAAALGVDLRQLLANCARFVYGSTTATNMFVQHRLPKVGHLCTRGHRDSLWFRDGYKPDRWNLRAPAPWQLVPRYLRRPVAGRIDSSGDVLTPLDEEEVREAGRFFRDDEVEAVGICFLWSFLNPAHERRAKEILQEELPDRPILISADVLPLIREWERAFCTCLSAGILAEVRVHLVGFRSRMRELGLEIEPLIMQCNGGHATIDSLLESPLSLIASGPAGGALAGVFYGDLAGSADVMTTDMGGTSFDVCVLPGRQVPITKERRLENEPIAIPSVEIHTIGAGGGSIAWLDQGGALQVGPRSAGARPGPACYADGGEEPTLTDAYLALGYLNADFFLGGRRRLDPGLAEAAIANKIAEPLGLDVPGAARRIVEITNSQLVDAMRLLSVQRGIDPRPFTLLVGGGAGPIQSGRLARALGMRRVLVPRHPGVFCALGQMQANVTHNAVRTYTTTAEAVDLSRLTALYAEMEASLVANLTAEGIASERIELARFIDARYTGQVYEVETPVPSAEQLTREHVTGIVSAFEDAHERLYHYRMDGFPAEFVSCRVEATGVVDELRLDELPLAGADASAAVKGKRNVYLPAADGFVEVDVYDGDRLEHGNVVEGVAIVETAGSTLGVWEDERLVVASHGDFELEIGLDTEA